MRKYQKYSQYNICASEDVTIPQKRANHVIMIPRSLRTFYRAIGKSQPTQFTKTRLLSNFHPLPSVDSFNIFFSTRHFNLIFFQHNESDPSNTKATLWDFTPENFKRVDAILGRYPLNYKQAAIIPLLVKYFSVHSISLFF